MAHAAGLFSFEKFQEHIDRTNHGGTLATCPPACNRWIRRSVLVLARREKRVHFPGMSDVPKLPGRLSAPHWYSGPRLWRTLKKATLSAGRKTLLTALILFYCLQDKDTPTWAKGVIVGSLGYLVLPTDLIPDILPGIGYGDDWGALVAALGTVAAYIKDEHKSKAQAQVARLFGSVNPVAPPEFFE